MTAFGRIRANRGGLFGNGGAEAILRVFGQYSAHFASKPCAMLRT